MPSLYLLAAVFLIWFWTNNPVLAEFNLQLTAFLIVIYFFVRTYSKLVWEITVFTAVLLLILASTGGLTSPLFFLTYFLIFAVSLLFEPRVVLTLTLGITLFFANSLNTLNAVFQVFSLLLITPLAIWLGKQYLKLLEAREKIKILSEEEQKNQKALQEEETNSLLWLSLNFKNSLLKIIYKSSELLADIGRLSPFQKENLQSIHETAKELLKSGEKLKEKIDKETDQ